MEMWDSSPLEIGFCLQRRILYNLPMGKGTMTIGGIHFDLKLIFVILFTTVIPMLDFYGHKITGTKAYDRFLLYFILPAAAILLIWREPLGNFGFKLGDCKSGLLWTLGACLVMAIILRVVGRLPAMQTYYAALAPKNLSRLVWLNGVELFGWEFIWRGFMLFALAKIFGPGPAILIQAVPFAFLHLGKPELETLTTVFGGIGFGYIAWQTNSFVYPWLIHWFIASFIELVALRII